VSGSERGVQVGVARVRADRLLQRGDRRLDAVLVHRQPRDERIAVADGEALSAQRLDVRRGLEDFRLLLDGGLGLGDLKL